MESIVHVNKADVPYAIICRNTKTDGIRYFSTEQDEFQLGLMERPTGYQVKAHTHPQESRPINGISEFLYIESGIIRVSVFDEEWVPLADEVLEAGDFLVFLRGGHAITILDAARIIEVKQGPYMDVMTSKLFRDST